MNSNVMESLLGAMVLMVAGGFLAFAYDRSGHSVGEAYVLEARFGRVDGLGIGSDVRMAGIKVGTVLEQHIDPETFEAVINFSVEQGIELPVDTAVLITAEGLLGGTYLAIQPGGDIEYLEPGDQIEETQDAVDLIGLINKFLYGGDSSATD